MNYCIIYRYILEKRRKTFAITRICGGAKFKISAVYMGELLGISVLTLTMGILFFSKVLVYKFEYFFEYIQYYYSASVYLAIALVYLAILFVSYLILIRKFVRKTPVSLIREV